MSFLQDVAEWSTPRIADATDLFGIAESLKTHYEKSGFYTKAVRDADLVYRNTRRDYERLCAVTRQEAKGTVQAKNDAVLLDPVCQEARHLMDAAEIDLDLAKGLKRDYETRVGILQTLKGIGQVLAGLSGFDGERPRQWKH